MSAHGRPTAGHMERPRGYPCKCYQITDITPLQARARQEPGTAEYTHAQGIGPCKNPWLPGKVTAWLCMLVVFGFILPCFT